MNLMNNETVQGVGLYSNPARQSCQILRLNAPQLQGATRQLVGLPLQIFDLTLSSLLQTTTDQLQYSPGASVGYRCAVL